MQLNHVIASITILVGSHHPSAMWAECASPAEAIEVIQPGLSVSVLREGLPNCSAPSAPLECLATGLPQIAQAVGVDAIGNFYSFANIGDGQQVIDFGAGRWGQLIQRTDPSGLTEDVVRVFTTICLGGVCTDIKGFRYGPQYHLDVTNGRILLPVSARNNSIPGCAAISSLAIVEIRGLPQMFDTLVTFQPSGQALSASTPAHPGGFRAADSLQVWTGDAHVMLNWSLAQRLTCEAAISPAPGQLVTVADTLPDPPLGSVR